MHKGRNVSYHAKYLPLFLIEGGGRHQKHITRGEEAVTPSFSMLAISSRRPEKGTNNNAGQNTNTVPQAQNRVNIGTAQERRSIHPGAFAVEGPDASLADDEYTLTAPAPSVQPEIPMLPVSARVVEEEEDYDDLQKQLRQRDEELRQQHEELQRQQQELERMRRNQQNVVVAQVICSNNDDDELSPDNDDEEGFPHDEEAQDNGMMEKEPPTTNDGLTSEGHARKGKQPKPSWCYSNRILVALGGILVLAIVGIVLGVALSKSTKAGATPPPTSPNPNSLAYELSSASLDESKFCCGTFL